MQELPAPRTGTPHGHLPGRPNLVTEVLCCYTAHQTATAAVGPVRMHEARLVMRQLRTEPGGANMTAEAYLTFSLTVSEGKRLIARSIAHLPEMTRALDEGIVVITRSTTAGYLVEELLGQEIDRTGFVTGRTIPAGHPERAKMLTADIPEIVLRGGEIDDDYDEDALIDELSPGDVIVKSPNALDYARGLVGYLIGAPTGGTVGKYLGPCHGKHLHFVAPCGLEKQVASDLVQASALLAEAGDKLKGPSLWTTPARIVTELDAIAMLTGATAIQIGAGGVMGAEGAVWITAAGSEEQIAKVKSLVEDIEGEPSMLEYAQR